MFPVADPAGVICTQWTGLNACVIRTLPIFAPLLPGPVSVIRSEVNVRKFISFENVKVTSYGPVAVAGALIATVGRVVS